MKNIQDQLLWITLLFFALGFVHMSLSLLGLLCFILPFVQYIKNKEKVWCKYYCPRAGYFNKIVSKINIGMKIPGFLKGKKLKKGVIIYFALTLFLVMMSTLMVTLGRIEPILQLRFLIVFGIPIRIPQLLNLTVAPNLLHLSYRIYSMMFSSVIIGTILGILYRPRTWCTICPINTLTTKKNTN